MPGCLREYVPLKQGLRLRGLSFITALSALREYVPLKQGLRRGIIYCTGAGIVLREYVPLKQGLRRQQAPSRSWHYPPRVCSTKTRIKTTRVRLPPARL